MQLVAPFQNQFEIESHTNAATVYLRGSLSAAGALGAVAACHSLPEPVRAETVFDAPGAAFSDHPGYLVKYRLTWSAETLATYRPNPSTVIKAHKLGVKVSWTR